MPCRVCSSQEPTILTQPHLGWPAQGYWVRVDRMSLMVLSAMTLRGNGAPGYTLSKASCSSQDRKLSCRSTSALARLLSTACYSAGAQHAASPARRSRRPTRDALHAMTSLSSPWPRAETCIAGYGPDVGQQPACSQLSMQSVGGHADPDLD